MAPRIFVLLLGLFLFPATLLAQLQGGPTTPQPRPPAPPSPSGSSPGRDRPADNGARRFARDFRNGERDQSRPNVPRSPENSPEVARRLSPVSPKFAKEYLDSLAERARRVKTLSFEGEVFIVSGASPATRRRIWYASTRDTTGLLKHRIAISDGASVQEVILIHEVVGERPIAWHLGKGGKPEILREDPLLLPLAAGIPFVLLDLVPFDPGRSKLEVEGESERDGQPVVSVKGTMLVGRNEAVSLAFHRHNRLLLRATASSKDALRAETAASELRERDGVAAYENLHIVDRDKDATLVLRLLNRRVNQRVDPAAFEPATFAP